MKIVDVRTIPLTWNATNPCMSAGTVSSSRSALIVEIETDTGIVDIGQPDLVWSGGFSEFRRIAAFAQAHNMMLSPHCFSSALLFVSALHFAASIPNALMIEWDQTPHALRTELLNEPFDYDGAGFMRVPNGPGLGVTLNRDTIERYRVA